MTSPCTALRCSNTYTHIGQWETYLSEAVFSLALACRCGCSRTWLCVNANVCMTDAGCLSCSSDLRSASTCDDVASSSNATFINCQHHTNTLITVRSKQVKCKSIECIVIKPLMLWSVWHKAWHDILERRTSEAAKPPAATDQCATNTERSSSSLLSTMTPGNSDTQCAHMLQTTTQ